MAHIKGINFAHVSKQHGCTCEKCGQYITNIWTVEYTDGLKINLGMDCFDKLNKSSNLNAYGAKLMKKTLQSIEKHKKGYEREKQLTEETDEAYQLTQQHVSWKADSAWYGEPWEEYHKWMLEVWWPARFAEDQENIDRFGKVNFAR